MGKFRDEQLAYSRDVGLIQRIEYSGNNAIYIGKAFPGALTSDLKWQLCKLTYDGSGNMTQLDWCTASDDFIFSWDLRATYSYS